MRGDPIVRCSNCSNFAHVPQTGLLPVPRLCTACVFWQERIEATGHPLIPYDIRVGGALYVLDYRDDVHSPVIDIRWLAGGHLRTTRLRFVAIIPAHLRAQLGDNAVATVIAKGSTV
jgi:hypothetical protein